MVLKSNKVFGSSKDSRFDSVMFVYHIKTSRVGLSYSVSRANRISSTLLFSTMKTSCVYQYTMMSMNKSNKGNVHH